MKRFPFFIVLVVVPASAQRGPFGPPPDVHPTGFFGVGFTTPVNPLATRLDAGWNLAGGIGVTQEYVGVMLDAMFTDFGITSAALAREGAARGSQKYWAVTVDPIFHVNQRGPLDFYITGGGGIYGQHTEFRVRSDSPRGSSRSFDLISSNTIYKPGVNGGAGFAFSLGYDTNIKVFAEARYHHMFVGGSDAGFIPVTIGVRF
jgi:hypothetical protein